MSGVSAISGTSALWTTTSTTNSSSSIEDTYSQIVSNLQSGGTSSGSGDSDSDDTVTTTRILSDGSVLITVMQDGKIVSETRTHPAKVEDDPSKLSITATTQTTGASALGVSGSSTANSLQQTLDKFNDTSTSILAGSLFTSEV